MILSQYTKREAVVPKSTADKKFLHYPIVNQICCTHMVFRTAQGGILPLLGPHKHCAVGLRGNARIEYHQDKEIPHVGHGSLQFTLGKAC
jgi:hypothetical protein